jgi:hypothetical protein
LRIDEIVVRRLLFNIKNETPAATWFDETQLAIMDKLQVIIWFLELRRHLWLQSKYVNIYILLVLFATVERREVHAIVPQKRWLRPPVGGIGFTEGHIEKRRRRNKIVGRAQFRRIFEPMFI